MTHISIIVALTEDRLIGKANGLLWHIPEDFKHFKKITTGHPIIMGRKTYQSIGRPLPNRTNFVITRDTHFIADGCIIVPSLEEAIAQASKIDTEEIFIIGGGQIYAQGIQYADKLYLTIVKGKFEGDTYFPDYSMFKKVNSRRASRDEKYEYEFVELEKE